MNQLTFSWRGASRSVRTMVQNESAPWEPPMKILVPLITYSSPSRTASVCVEARSEPASGPVRSCQVTVSPRKIGGRSRRFCSSLPQTRMLAPPRLPPLS